MSAVRLILKEFRFAKKLWDKIVQAIIYVKNRNISQTANGITPYKGVNKFIFSIAYFYAFRCQYYINVSDTIMC